MPYNGPATQKIIMFQAQPVSYFLNPATAELKANPFDIPFRPSKLASDPDANSASNPPSQSNQRAKPNHLGATINPTI